MTDPVLFYRRALASPEQPVELIIADALTNPAGRQAIIARRHELAANLANADAESILAGAAAPARRALEELTAFDLHVQAATGVTSSAGRVRHRGTHEVGEVLGHERGVTGVPYVRVRFDDEGPSGSPVLLVDVERIAVEPQSSPRAWVRS